MRRPAQALVEFALAISVFMLLVLGTFDLARAYLVSTVMADVAREASRYGAAHANTPSYVPADAKNAGKSHAVGLDTSDSVLSLIVEAPTGGALSYIRVHGTYDFHSITPGVGALLGDPIIIKVDTSTLIG